MQFDELHNRYLQRNKILVLQANKEDYNELMSLSTEARSELHRYVTKNMVYEYRNDSI